MPNYDLRCKACGTRFQSKASIAARSAKQIECPACGAHELDAVYTAAPAVHVRPAGEPACPKGGACPGCPHAAGRR